MECGAEMHATNQSFALESEWILHETESLAEGDRNPRSGLETYRLSFQRTGVLSNGNVPASWIAQQSYLVLYYKKSMSPDSSSTNNGFNLTLRLAR